VDTPDDLPIYPIRTAAQLTGVDARRLRSWESEYQLLRPARTRGGHRLYSSRDLRLIQQIKRLVDEEGMSLQGIKAWLAAQNGPVDEDDPPETPRRTREPGRPAAPGHAPLPAIPGASGRG
jgi:DNA-binding transcriptional MerR regulator